jgi:hypothetical protein
MPKSKVGMVIRHNVNTFYTFLITHSTFTVVVFSALVQILLIGQYLDNSIVSPYAPTAMDAMDYTSRADIWRQQSFTEAFSDLVRMPGYPFLILINNLLISDYAFLAVRCFQLVALSLSTGLIKIVLQQYTSLKIAIFVSSLFALLPIWHFVPVLIAESLTAVTVIAIVYYLSRIHNKDISIRQIFMISVCIAIGTYLKPNNILIVIPILGFLVFSDSSRIIKTISRILFFVLVLLLPWFGFTSNAQQGFFGLTANSGLNAYVGTGMILNYDGGILANSAIKLKVDPNSNPTDKVDALEGDSPVARNSLYTQKSIEIWQKRFLRELAFGFEKVKFAFGLNSDSKFELLFGVFNFLGLLSGLLLLRYRAVRPWGVALILVAVTLSIQAIIFQADRRFVIPVYSPFAVVCMGIVFQKILKYVLGRTSHDA